MALRCPGDEDAIDPVAVHVDHLEVQPPVIEGFADARDMTELGNYEARQGVEIAFRNRGQLEQVAKFVEGQPAVQEPRAIRPLDHRGLVFLVGDRHVADESFKDVGEGEQAFDGSVFVEDDGDARPRCLEHLEDFESASAFVKEEGQGQSPLDPKRLAVLSLAPEGP